MDRWRRSVENLFEDSCSVLRGGGDNRSGILCCLVLERLLTGADIPFAEISAQCRAGKFPREHSRQPGKLQIHRRLFAHNLLFYFNRTLAYFLLVPATEICFKRGNKRNSRLIIKKEKVV